MPEENDIPSDSVLDRLRGLLPQLNFEDVEASGLNSTLTTVLQEVQDLRLTINAINTSLEEDRNQARASV